jgi:acetolactate synthase-1/2/3 large subunit
LGKNVTTQTSLVAECGEFLEKLEPKLWGMHLDREWLRELDKRKVLPSQGSKKLLDPRLVLEAINDLVDDDTIIVTDVGQHQMWSALFLHPHGPNKFLTSGGLGTMGFGFPAAIGAQMANPEKRVVLITGDGSFQMNLQELAIVKKFGLPIKIMLFDNGYLGMVRQWQELFFQENYAETTLDVGPDWIRLAEAYSVQGVLVDNAPFFTKTLNSVWNSGKPCLLDLKIDPGANVFPIVPAGASIDEMWGSGEDEAYASSNG